MLQSLNTGHDGSLSTLHANSSQDMLSRIETMTLMGIDLPLEAIRRQIASGVEYSGASWAYAGQKQKAAGNHRSMWI